MKPVLDLLFGCFEYLYIGILSAISLMHQQFVNADHFFVDELQVVLLLLIVAVIFYMFFDLFYHCCQGHRVLLHGFELVNEIRLLVYCPTASEIRNWQLPLYSIFLHLQRLIGGGGVMRALSERIKRVKRTVGHRACWNSSHGSADLWLRDRSHT